MNVAQMEAIATDLAGRLDDLAIRTEALEQGTPGLTSSLAALSKRVNDLELHSHDSYAPQNNYFISGSGTESQGGIAEKYTTQLLSSEVAHEVTENTLVILHIPENATTLGECSLEVGGEVILEKLPENKGPPYVITFIVPAGKNWIWKFSLGGEVGMGVAYLGLGK